MTRPAALLSDLVVAGCLHAAVVRSPHPHARVGAIDTAAARAMAGVAAVITAADIPGRNLFGMRVHDQPVLCAGQVRCIGDPVAAVAAATLAQARAAAAAIRVAWIPLPAVTDPDAALGPDAPALHPGGNLLHRTWLLRGDPDAALDAAAHVVTATYHTPRQAPGFIEPETAVAIPDGERLTLYAPGHWAAGEQRHIAVILGCDPALIRVVASPVGGSYGGKDCLHAQPIAALLARAAGRPVRLTWTRADSFAMGPKRHPCRITLRAGCDAAGRLVALDAALLGDSGAYAQHGPEVLATAHENLQGVYAWPAVRLEGRFAYTNNGISGAMRGFGALQAQVAIEQHMDRLATACGVDPVAFRARNLRADDGRGPLGQRLAAPTHARLALARLEPPEPPRAEGRHVIAHGIALVEKGEGFSPGGPNHATARLGVAADGAIELRLGLSELGQGIAAAGAAAVAAQLGCAAAEVRVVLGDSATTPDSGSIAASRGAGIAWRSVAACLPGFLAALRARAGDQSLRPGPGGLWRPGGNAAEIGWAALGPLKVEGSVAPVIAAEVGMHAAFTACAAWTEIARDTLTGQVAVRRVRLWPVSGPVLSPAGLRGQMEGAAAMAAGFVTLESLPSEAGRFRAANLDLYLLPTIADAPVVDVAAIADIPADALGPRGVSEVALNAAAAAIACAVQAGR